MRIRRKQEASHLKCKSARVLNISFLLSILGVACFHGGLLYWHSMNVRGKRITHEHSDNRSKSIVMISNAVTHRDNISSSSSAVGRRSGGLDGLPRKAVEMVEISENMEVVKLGHWHGPSRPSWCRQHADNCRLYHYHAAFTTMLQAQRRRRGGNCSIKTIRIGALYYDWHRTERSIIQAQIDSLASCQVPCEWVGYQSFTGNKPDVVLSQGRAWEHRQQKIRDQTGEGRLLDLSINTTQIVVHVNLEPPEHPNAPFYLQKTDTTVLPTNHYVVDYMQGADLRLNYGYSLQRLADRSLNHFVPLPCNRSCVYELYLRWNRPQRFYLHRLNRIKKIRVEKRLNAAAIFLSNCQSNDRMKYLIQLSKLMQFDSYGSCFPERRPKFKVDGGKRYDDNAKNRVLQSGYKFLLAFESYVVQGYVTEKLWSSWPTGAVPIYFGAPDIRGYLPADSSQYPKQAILANELSPEELASWVQYLDSNDTAYLEFLSWRSVGDRVIREEFVDMIETEGLFSMGQYSIPCRLCQLWAQKCKT